MHVLGKVFLALTIVFALVDVYLASVLLRNRTYWEERIEKRQKDYETAHTNRVTNEAKLSTVQHELDRINTTWTGSVTASEGGFINVGQATLRVGAGTAQGLPEVVTGEPLKEMYVFFEDDAGESHYVGAFRLQQCQADQSAYTLARDYLYPDEGENAKTKWKLIPPNAKWRVRLGVPSSWRSGFADLDITYARAMKNLDNQRDFLRIGSEQLAASQGVLDQRYAELNGDPQPPEGASQDVIDGLVLTLRKEETARNAGLQRVDELRHDYKRKIDKLNELVEGNQKAVNALPGAKEAGTRPVASGPLATTDGSGSR